MSDKSAENLRRIRAWDAEWDESKHSRADNGQFTSGGGGGKSSKSKSKIMASGMTGGNLALSNYFKGFRGSEAEARKVFDNVAKKHKMDPDAICKDLNSRADVLYKFKPWKFKLVNGFAIVAEDRSGNKSLIKFKN